MPRLTKNIFKPVARPKATSLGGGGFDNIRENIDPHVRTQVVSTKEGTIEKVPVNGNDIVNKDYADGLVFGTAGTDHALLSNLTYASAGHIGFVASASLLTHTSSTSIHTPNTNTTYNATVPIDITGTTISIPKASTSVNGYLSSADWDTFNSAGSSDHSALSNLTYASAGHIGFVASASLNTHTSSASIHYTENSIDHTNISNIGTNTHAQVDTHIASSSIHFATASLSHTEIQDIGSNTHAQIDTHIASSAIHFTEGSISIPASQISDFDTEVSNNSDVVSLLASTHAQNTDTILGQDAVALDHGTGTVDVIVNVSYGTSATPPTAANTTEGSLYIQYTP